MIILCTLHVCSSLRFKQQTDLLPCRVNATEQILIVKRVRLFSLLLVVYSEYRNRSVKMRCENPPTTYQFHFVGLPPPNQWLANQRVKTSISHQTDF